MSFDPREIRTREHGKFGKDTDDQIFVFTRDKQAGDKLDDIITALSGSTDTDATVYNVDCAIADTEYNLALPANCKGFVLKARGTSKIKFNYLSFTTNYFTISAGAVLKDENFYASQTIYFRCSKADEVIEVIAYAKP